MKLTKTELRLKEGILNSLRDIEKETGNYMFREEVDDIHLGHPQNQDFGDYYTNTAMSAYRSLAEFTKSHVNEFSWAGRWSNPVDVAREIAKNIEINNELNGLIEKIEVAGNGFINFYLKPEYLLSISDLPEDIGKYGEGKRVIVEYSSPNIAKPFGIGHLRSTNIGQAIYNIYQSLGWETIGDNHFGDWGTQFGKMMTAIVKYQNKDVRFQISDPSKKIDDLTIQDLEKLYVLFHQAAETDETLIDEGREWFAKLEKGDVEAREMWNKCVEISLKEFNRVYDLLGVKIDNAHGEAFYENMLPEVIEDFKKAGLAKESQGALIVEFEDMTPAILLKSNDTTTYFTRDLATIKYRVNKWNPDLIIYEVGMEQILHFKQVFAAAEKIGWISKEKLYHLPHGLIRWASGKFSTRKGDTIHLADILDKAVEGAQKVAEASVVSKGLNQEDQKEMINKVAIGAVKFTDLASDPRKDVIFDWDKMMDLQGDSGPYLQYTYSRTRSVLEKSDIKETGDLELNNLTKSEMSLLREFYKFEEKIIEAAERYSPSVVAEYLLGLARKYNEFYAKDKIIGDANESRRIFLTKTTGDILKKGLELLGIETVEKM